MANMRVNKSAITTISQSVRNSSVFKVYFDKIETLCACQTEQMWQWSVTKLAKFSAGMTY